MVQGARECVTAILLTAAAISGCSDNENPLGAAIQEPGLALYLPLNGDAIDLSGHENNGAPEGVFPTVDRFGTVNGALLFTGSNSRITIASTAAIRPDSQLTISFWARVDSIANATSSPIVHKGGQATPTLDNREYALYLQGDSAGLHFAISSAGDGAGQHTTRSRGIARNLSRWLFVAIVVDRRSHVMQVYVDGAIDTSAADSYSGFNNNSNPLTIGSEAETGWPDHSPYRGALDEFRLYTRALSAAEVRVLYLKR